MSLETGVLPSDWTDAYIVPIHKKGPKKDPANYRPISLTSAVCKILERLICHRIRHHLEINNLLSVNQHGFRERRSCESQIIQVVHDIITSLDSKCPVDIMYFDFSWAFDVVPHSFLIQKLKKNGITGKILKWIKSFLFKRRQRVNVNGVNSSWCSVASGVPQGTITGPLSFLVYINDITDNIKSKCKLYADDLVLYRTIENNNDQCILQEDINTIYEWSQQWGLSLNIKKCKVMHVANKNIKQVNMCDYHLGEVNLVYQKKKNI